MADPAEKFSFEFAVTSQCLYCKHLSRLDDVETGMVCAAFPGGIPEEILTNSIDHRKPVEGDEGMGEPGTHVLFDPREDVPEPVLEALCRELDATHGEG